MVFSDEADFVRALMTILFDKGGSQRILFHRKKGIMYN